MYFGSLTVIAWVSKSRESIFIYVESAGIFCGYIIVELGVVICPQVFCYVNLPRQFDDNIAVLMVLSSETKMPKSKSHTVFW